MNLREVILSQCQYYLDASLTVKQSMMLFQWQRKPLSFILKVWWNIMSLFLTLKKQFRHAF